MGSNSSKSKPTEQSLPKSATRSIRQIFTSTTRRNSVHSTDEGEARPLVSVNDTCRSSIQQETSNVQATRRSSVKLNPNEPRPPAAIDVRWNHRASVIPTTATIQEEETTQTTTTQKQTSSFCVCS
jgi:hypothetical protein